jgi:hypothetical protein
MPDGPINVGVIAGNNQVVTAAPLAPLPSQVVTQAVRLPNGTVALRTRVVDALLPERAYAQTAVNGVPNVVVCAKAPDPKHALTADVQCANTDANGKAYFTFKADTVAGVSKAQVAASLSTGTKITDSVSATVNPGAFAWSPAVCGPARAPGAPYLPCSSWPGRVGPATYPAEIALDQYNNAVPFKFVVLSQGYFQYDSAGTFIVRPGPTNFAHAVSDTLGAQNARTIAADSVATAPFGGAVRGLVQIVTANGVSATAVLVVKIQYSSTGVRTEVSMRPSASPTLNARPAFSSRRSCSSASSNACRCRTCSAGAPSAE